MSPIARINRLLKAKGHVERMVRNTRGGSYYYLTATEAGPVTESLYVYSLQDTPEDHSLAQQYVEEQLSIKLGGDHV